MGVTTPDQEPYQSHLDSFGVNCPVLDIPFAGYNHTVPHLIMVPGRVDPISPLLLTIEVLLLLYHAPANANN